MTGSLQVKNGRYYAVLNFKNNSGKRVQKWISLNLDEKGNKRKAELALRDLLNQYQDIESIEPLNTLLSVHICALIKFNKYNIAVTTYNQYVNMLTLHIAPYFNYRSITLSSVTAGDLEDYYAYKMAQGLSPNTVIKHNAVIRSSLQWAVKHRYIKENVADCATRPKKVKYEGNMPYTIQEISNLLYLTQNEPISVPIFLASFYGLRRSEVLGLRWSAIDFNSGWLHISTTVVKEMEDNKVNIAVREDTTKTYYSKRSLPLCQYTLQYLMTLRQKQLYQQQICGASYINDYIDFVCVDDMGMLLQPDFVSQKFQKILKKYDLRPIRYHDLRHSCATIMLNLGYSVKDIQTWLGHSNYNFTADTYVHTVPTSHEEMASTFAQQLLGSPNENG